MSTTGSLPHTGFGLLGLTWRPKMTPDEQAFAAMKAAVENGATLWSSSASYGMAPEPQTAGLSLLRRYFERYPEDASKVTLFIRACFDSATFQMTCTREGVRASWTECDSILGGVKKMDIFGPARMDQDVPVEETIGAMKELQDEGKIGGVGLSEVRAETVRRAAAVCSLRVVEIEFSLWNTEILTNGVAATCKELGVPMLAYAPLGYGFLTGAIKTLDDIPEGDLRRQSGRFQPEHFAKNLEVADKINTFAVDKGVKPTQLALAWIRAHSNTENCGTIIPIPGATAAERVNENCKVVELSEKEKAELGSILSSFPVHGHRQVLGFDKFLWT